MRYEDLSLYFLDKREFDDSKEDLYEEIAIPKCFERIVYLIDKEIYIHLNYMTKEVLNVYSSYEELVQTNFLQQFLVLPRKPKGIE